ncbi:MAG: sortase [Dehalococcoidia bacterium]|jgi:LPXTG-site transpeptidase (sortase) family protein
MLKQTAVLIAVLVLFAVSLAPARALDEPTVIGWLYVPALRMAEPLYESAIGADGYHIIPAENAVHLSGTAWLDTTYADLIINGGGTPTGADYYPAGRIVVAGHNPGVFGAKGGLQVGDALYLAKWPLVVRFEVVGVFVVDVQDTSWLAPVADSRLVLTACIGEQRMIIEAVRTG